MPAVWMPGSRASACSGEGSFFSRAELSDARFCLRETPDGEMNIKQVVDNFPKGQGPGGGKIRLEIERLETDGLDFSMERLEHRNPSYGWISPICT
mgnify:CR=1 FL=1